MSEYKKYSFSTRVIAVFTAIVFFLSNDYSIRQAHAHVPLSPQVFKNILNDLSAIHLPKEFGTIQESYQGSSDKIAILVQDAHSIPDAQKNIQNIIHFFQKEYGVSRVGVEGTSSKLDPQIFHSFPDQKRLKDVFASYQEKGELTGAVAAAIFRETSLVKHEAENSSRDTLHASPITFQGIENWSLYEQGVKEYLKALEQQKEVSEALSVKREALEKDKEKFYSKELREVDQGLHAFHENKLGLIEVLQVLSKYQAPDGELGLILKKSTDELEVKRVAKEVEKQIRQSAKRIEQSVKPALTPTPLPRGEGKGEGKSRYALSAMLYAEFQGKKQLFQTSQISEEEYALYLKELIQKYKLPIQFSSSLHQSADDEKKLRDIQGTSLFKNFELYARFVKEELFKNDEERMLDKETRELELFAKLSKLELSFEEWKKLKTIDHSPQTIDQSELWTMDHRLWTHHKNFYQISEQRENAFLKNLQRAWIREQRGEKNSMPSALCAMLVLGGFHTEGLAEKFKKLGTSYVVVTPAISHLPEENLYLEHMKGNVSWKDYFRVENGRVNPYEAFVRATRDKLLVGSKGLKGVQKGLRGNDSFSFQPALPLVTPFDPILKNWRDNIIRDLAAKNELTKANEYTRFIDELSREQGAESRGLNSMPYALSSMRELWLQNIHRFISGLKDLKSRGEMNVPNVTSLLNSFSTVPLATSNVLSDGWIDVSVLGLRSEVLSSAKPATSNLKLETSEKRSEVRAKRMTSRSGEEQGRSKAVEDWISVMTSSLDKYDHPLQAWDKEFRFFLGYLTGMAVSAIGIHGFPELALFKERIHHAHRHLIQPEFLSLQDLQIMGAQLDAYWKKRGWNQFGPLAWLITLTGNYDTGTAVEKLESIAERINSLMHAQSRELLMTHWLDGLSMGGHLRYFAPHIERRKLYPHDIESLAVDVRRMIPLMVAQRVELTSDHPSTHSNRPIKASYFDLMLWGLSIMLDPTILDMRFGVINKNKNNTYDTPEYAREIWGNDHLEPIRFYFKKMLSGLEEVNPDGTKTGWLLPVRQIEELLALLIVALETDYFKRKDLRSPNTFVIHLLGQDHHFSTLEKAPIKEAFFNYALKKGMVPAIDVKIESDFEHSREVKNTARHNTYPDPVQFLKQFLFEDSAMQKILPNLERTYEKTKSRQKKRKSEVRNKADSSWLMAGSKSDEPRAMNQERFAESQLAGKPVTGAPVTERQRSEVRAENESNYNEFEVLRQDGKLLLLDTPRTALTNLGAFIHKVNLFIHEIPLFEDPEGRLNNLRKKADDFLQQNFRNFYQMQDALAIQERLSKNPAEPWNNRIADERKWLEENVADRARELLYGLESLRQVLQAIRSELRVKSERGIRLEDNSPKIEKIQRLLKNELTPLLGDRAIPKPEKIKGELLKRLLSFLHFFLFWIPPVNRWISRHYPPEHYSDLGWTIDERRNYEALKKSRDRIFEIGAQNLTLQAHGTQFLNTFLQIILHGKLRDRYRMGQLRGTSGIDAAFGMSAGDHGPYYLIGSHDSETLKIDFLLVPETIDRDAIISVLKKAAEAPYNLLEPSIESELSRRILTYSEFESRVSEFRPDVKIPSARSEVRLDSEISFQETASIYLCATIQTNLEIVTQLYARFKELTKRKFDFVGDGPNASIPLNRLASADQDTLLRIAYEFLSQKGAVFQSAYVDLLQPDGKINFGIYLQDEAQLKEITEKFGEDLKISFVGRFDQNLQRYMTDQTRVKMVGHDKREARLTRSAEGQYQMIASTEKISDSPLIERQRSEVRAEKETFETMFGNEALQVLNFVADISDLSQIQNYRYENFSDPVSEKVVLQHSFSLKNGQKIVFYTHRNFKDKEFEINQKVSEIERAPKSLKIIATGKVIDSPDLRPGGIPLMVQKAASGKSLSEILTREFSLDLIAEIATALGDLHRIGIVHKDLITYFIQPKYVYGNLNRVARGKSLSGISDQKFNLGLFAGITGALGDLHRIGIAQKDRIKNFIQQKHIYVDESRPKGQKVQFIDFHLSLDIARDDISSYHHHLEYETVLNEFSSLDQYWAMEVRDTVHEIDANKSGLLNVIMLWLGAFLRGFRFIFLKPFISWKFKKAYQAALFSEEASNDSTSRSEALQRSEVRNAKNSPQIDLKVLVQDFLKENQDRFPSNRIESEFASSDLLIQPKDAQKIEIALKFHLSEMLSNAFDAQKTGKIYFSVTRTPEEEIKVLVQNELNKTAKEGLLMLKELALKAEGRMYKEYEKDGSDYGVYGILDENISISGRTLEKVLEEEMSASTGRTYRPLSRAEIEALSVEDLVFVENLSSKRRNPNLFEVLMDRVNEGGGGIGLAMLRRWAAGRAKVVITDNEFKVEVILPIKAVRSESRMILGKQEKEVRSSTLEVRGLTSNFQPPTSNLAESRSEVRMDELNSFFLGSNPYELFINQPSVTEESANKNEPKKSYWFQKIQFAFLPIPLEILQIAGQSLLALTSVGLLIVNAWKADKKDLRADLQQRFGGLAYLAFQMAIFVVAPLIAILVNIILIGGKRLIKLLLANALFVGLALTVRALLASQYFVDREPAQGGQMGVLTEVKTGGDGVEAAQNLDSLQTEMHRLVETLPMPHYDEVISNEELPLGQREHAQEMKAFQMGDFHAFDEVLAVARLASRTQADIDRAVNTLGERKNISKISLYEHPGYEGLDEAQTRLLELMVFQAEVISDRPEFDEGLIREQGSAEYEKVRHLLTNMQTYSLHFQVIKSFTSIGLGNYDHWGKVLDWLNHHEGKSIQSLGGWAEVINAPEVKEVGKFVVTPAFGMNEVWDILRILSSTPYGSRKGFFDYYQNLAAKDGAERLKKVATIVKLVWFEDDKQTKLRSKQDREKLIEFLLKRQAGRGFDSQTRSELRSAEQVQVLDARSEIRIKTPIDKFKFPYVGHKVIEALNPLSWDEILSQVSNADIGDHLRLMQIKTQRFSQADPKLASSARFRMHETVEILALRILLPGGLANKQGFTPPEKSAFDMAHNIALAFEIAYASDLENGPRSEVRANWPEELPEAVKNVFTTKIFRGLPDKKPKFLKDQRVEKHFDQNDMASMNFSEYRTNGQPIAEILFERRNGLFSGYVILLDTQSVLIYRVTETSLDVWEWKNLKRVNTVGRDHQNAFKFLDESLPRESLLPNQFEFWNYGYELNVASSPHPYPEFYELTIPQSVLRDESKLDAKAVLESLRGLLKRRQRINLQGAQFDIQSAMEHNRLNQEAGLRLFALFNQLNDEWNDSAAAELDQLLATFIETGEAAYFFQRSEVRSLDGEIDLASEIEEKGSDSDSPSRFQYFLRHSERAKKSSEKIVQARSLGDESYYPDFRFLTNRNRPESRSEVRSQKEKSKELKGVRSIAFTMLKLEGLGLVLALCDVYLSDRMPIFQGLFFIGVSMVFLGLTTFLFWFFRVNYFKNSNVQKKVFLYSFRTISYINAALGGIVAAVILSNFDQREFLPTVIRFHNPWMLLFPLFLLLEIIQSSIYQIKYGKGSGGAIGRELTKLEERTSPSRSEVRQQSTMRMIPSRTAREVLETGRSVPAIISEALKQEKEKRGMSQGERIKMISRMIEEISKAVYQGNISETEQIIIHNLALFILNLESSGGIYKIQRSTKTGNPILEAIGMSQVSIETLGDMVKRDLFLPSERDFLIRELGLQGESDLKQIVTMTRGDPTLTQPSPYKGKGEGESIERLIGRALAMSVIQNDRIDLLILMVHIRSELRENYVPLTAFDSPQGYFDFYQWYYRTTKTAENRMQKAFDAVSPYFIKPAEGREQSAKSKLLNPLPYALRSMLPNSAKSEVRTGDEIWDGGTLTDEPEATAKAQELLPVMSIEHLPRNAEEARVQFHDAENKIHSELIRIKKQEENFFAWLQQMGQERKYPKPAYDQFQNALAWMQDHPSEFENMLSPLPATLGAWRNFFTDATAWWFFMEAGKERRDMHRSEVRGSRRFSRRFFMGMLAAGGGAAAVTADILAVKIQDHKEERSFPLQDYVFEVREVNEDLLKKIRNKEYRLVSTANPFLDQNNKSIGLVVMDGKVHSKRNLNTKERSMQKALAFFDDQGRLFIFHNIHYEQALKWFREKRLNILHGFQSGPVAVLRGHINDQIWNWYRGLSHGKAFVLGRDLQGNVYTKAFWGVDAVGFFGKIFPSNFQKEFEKWKNKNKIYDAIFVDSGTAGIGPLNRMLNLHQSNHVVVARDRTEIMMAKNIQRGNGANPKPSHLAASSQSKRSEVRTVQYPERLPGYLGKIVHVFLRAEQAMLEKPYMSSSALDAYIKDVERNRRFMIEENSALGAAILDTNNWKDELRQRAEEMAKGEPLHALNQIIEKENIGKFDHKAILKFRKWILKNKNWLPHKDSESIDVNKTVYYGKKMSTFGDKLLYVIVNEGLVDTVMNQQIHLPGMSDWQFYVPKLTSNEFLDPIMQHFMGRYTMVPALAYPGERKAGTFEALAAILYLFHGDLRGSGYETARRFVWDSFYQYMQSGAAEFDETLRKVIEFQYEKTKTSKSEVRQNFQKGGDLSAESGMRPPVGEAGNTELKSEIRNPQSEIRSAASSDQKKSEVRFVVELGENEIWERGSRMINYNSNLGENGFKQEREFVRSTLETNQSLIPSALQKYGIQPDQVSFFILQAAEDVSGHNKQAFRLNLLDKEWRMIRSFAVHSADSSLRMVGSLDAELKNNARMAAAQNLSTREHYVTADAVYHETYNDKDRWVIISEWIEGQTLKKLFQEKAYTRPKPGPGIFNPDWVNGPYKTLVTNVLRIILQTKKESGLAYDFHTDDVMIDQKEQIRFVDAGGGNFSEEFPTLLVEILREYASRFETLKGYELESGTVLNAEDIGRLVTEVYGLEEGLKLLEASKVYFFQHAEQYSATSDFYRRQGALLEVIIEKLRSELRKDFQKDGGAEENVEGLRSEVRGSGSNLKLQTSNLKLSNLAASSDQTALPTLRAGNGSRAEVRSDEFLEADALLATKSLSEFAEKIRKQGGNPETLQPYLSEIQSRKWPVLIEPERLLDATPAQIALFKQNKPLQFSQGIIFHGHPDADQIISSDFLENSDGIGTARTPHYFATKDFKSKYETEPAIFVIGTDVFNEYLHQGKASLKLHVTSFEKGDVEAWSGFIDPVPLERISEIWVSEETGERYRKIVGELSKNPFAAKLKILFNQNKIKVISGLWLRHSSTSLADWQKGDPGHLVDRINRYILQRNLLKDIPVLEPRSEVGNQRSESRRQKAEPFQRGGGEVPTGTKPQNPVAFSDSKRSELREKTQANSFDLARSSLKPGISRQKKSKMDSEGGGGAGLTRGTLRKAEINRSISSWNSLTINSTSARVYSRDSSINQPALDSNRETRVKRSGKPVPTPSSTLMSRASMDSSRASTLGFHSDNSTTFSNTRSSFASNASTSAPTSVLVNTDLGSDIISSKQTSGRSLSANQGNVNIKNIQILYANIASFIKPEEVTFVSEKDLTTDEMAERIVAMDAEGISIEEIQRVLEEQVQNWIGRKDERTMDDKQTQFIDAEAIAPLMKQWIASLGVYKNQKFNLAIRVTDNAGVDGVIEGIISSQESIDRLLLINEAKGNIPNDITVKLKNNQVLFTAMKSMLAARKANQKVNQGRLTVLTKDDQGILDGELSQIGIQNPENVEDVLLEGPEGLLQVVLGIHLAAMNDQEFKDRDELQKILAEKIFGLAETNVFQIKFSEEGAIQIMVSRSHFREFLLDYQMARTSQISA